MANPTLKALTNTVIKSLPKDSTTLDNSQKFPLAKGESLPIKQYRSAPNNHWEIQFETPRDGIITWFAFISHVEIFVDANFKPTLVDITTKEWEFFKKGTKKEREDGFWQRIVTYWKEALKRKDIDTPFDVGNIPWSAAFISWIMTKAGAANQFKRSASHSVYIRDTVKKRKEKVVNAPFVAFKINEVTPEVGDLVCAPRQSGITYNTTGSYISHCDLVVAKRASEIDIIGGNVSNSVTQKTLKLDSNGRVKDTTRPWFVVIKNLL